MALLKGRCASNVEEDKKCQNIEANEWRFNRWEEEEDEDGSREKVINCDDEKSFFTDIVNHDKGW